MAVPEARSGDRDFGADDLLPGAARSNWVDSRSHDEVKDETNGLLFQVYADRLVAHAQQDTDVHLQFLEMAHMLKPPSSLLNPRLMLKALFWV